MEQFYPGHTEVLAGEHATKHALLSKPLHRYHTLVFGTHGYYGYEIPGIMEPVLVLSLVPKGADGYLRMSEVLGLDLNADVVALTACRTALGEYRAGEGVMSMGRAFQYAGARTVLMSLWNVSEQGSVKLMERFFAHLRNGLRPPDALRTARNELRTLSPFYAHPYFWASFVVMGEAGASSQEAFREVGRKFLEAPPRRSRSYYEAAPGQSRKN